MIKIRLEQAFKFQKGLIVKSDDLHIVNGDARFLQAIRNRIFREALIVFFTRKPLLLCGGNNDPVFNETCRAIVLKSRNAEYIHKRFPHASTGEKRVQLFIL